jgi:hypothetical protein
VNLTVTQKTIIMKRIFYTFFLIAFSVHVHSQCSNTSSSSYFNFQWDGSTVFGPFATHATNEVAFKKYNYASGNPSLILDSLTISAKTTDPNNRLTTINYTAEVSASNNGPFSNVVSKNNGVYGAGYFTLGMTSENSDEFVTFEYKFNSLVKLCNLEISDIDYETFGGNATNNYISYQDEVDITAYNGTTVVPVTFSKAAWAPLTITGQKILADYDLTNAFGDVSPGSDFGMVFLNTTQDIDRIVIKYSNGPADDGKSNDHAIRIGGVNVFKSPISLPVSIADFKAFEKNGTVLASLQVVNESAIQSYTLQRLQGAGNWIKIAQIPATRSNVYNFTDPLPLVGSNQYRVAILHQDGSSTYSGIQTVKIQSAKDFFVNYNNQQLVIKANSKNTQQVYTNITNTQGVVVYKKQITLNEGLNNIQLNDLHLTAQGIYIVRIGNAEGSLFTAKIME